MDARALRFECLHLAHEHYVHRTGVNPADVVAMAKAYHDYVAGEHKPVAQPRGANGRFAKTASAKTMADLVNDGQLTGDPEFDAETDRLWDEHVARSNKAVDFGGPYTDGLKGLKERFPQHFTLSSGPEPEPQPESETSFIRRCFGRF